MSQRSDNEQIIRTQRLYLRPLSEEDGPALHPILSNADVMKWTPSGPVHSLDEAREWIKTRAIGRRPFHFIIPPSSRVRARPSASARLAAIVSHTLAISSIPVISQKEFANQGYATEALRAIIPGVFAILARVKGSDSQHDQYIEARTMSENVASQRVLVKCRFELWQETAQEKQTIKIYRLAEADATL